MIRICYTSAIGLVLSALVLTAPLSQEVQGEDGKEAEVVFDSEPFLKSLLELRRTALNCDGFVRGDPAARTAGVDDFFTSLKMNVPDLANQKTRDSLGMVIKPQAGQICKDELNAAYDNYEAQAKDYLSNKPKEWPEPPRVTKTEWCTQPNCADLG